MKVRATTRPLHFEFDIVADTHQNQLSWPAAFNGTDCLDCPFPSQQGSRCWYRAIRMCAVSDQVDRRELLEMALRPLGALGTAAEFPRNRAGIEALIARLAQGRPSEPRHFAYEDGVALPRYDGEYTTWLSPAGDGALRVRREHPWELTSVAVVLRADGRIGKFEEIDGFGVPDSELTEVARADRKEFELRVQAQEESVPDHEEWLEEHQTRFRTENLARTVVAPPGQHPGNPVVAYLSLYETGVQVNYLMPQPPDEILNPEDPEDPFAEPHMEAMFPKMAIDDGLGTEFEVVDLDHVDSNSSPLRARLSFAPAVPASATTLRIVFDSVTVEVDLEGS